MSNSFGHVSAWLMHLNIAVVAQKEATLTATFVRLRRSGHTGLLMCHDPPRAFDSQHSELCDRLEALLRPPQSVAGLTQIHSPAGSRVVPSTAATCARVLATAAPLQIAAQAEGLQSACRTACCLTCATRLPGYVGSTTPKRWQVA